MSYRLGVDVGGTFTDLFLQWGTTYTFVVRAFDNAQNHSSPSNALTVSTLTDTNPPAGSRYYRLQVPSP